MDLRIVIGVIAAVIVLAIVAWAVVRRRRSDQLRAHFGPEYDRAVQRHRDPGLAEAELAKREKRVQRLEIRPLADTARQRYAQHWWDVQRRFVDDPRSAVSEADDLVSDVMSARGYPMGDFEQRAADISVDHPRVVENYRAAHDIALRHQSGEAGTEDLRKAMVHYRSLFEELLEQRMPDRKEVA